MTPERLAKLRGMVERGELGAGPLTTELVRELLEAYDERARLFAAAVEELSRSANLWPSEQVLTSEQVNAMFAKHGQ